MNTLYNEERDENYTLDSKMSEKARMFLENPIVVSFFLEKEKSCVEAFKAMPFEASLPQFQEIQLYLKILKDFKQSFIVHINKFELKKTEREFIEKRETSDPMVIYE